MGSVGIGFGHGFLRSHTIPSFQKVLELGFAGIRAEAQSLLGDGDTVARSLREAVIIACDPAIVFAWRNARLARSGIPLRFRTPVIPGENDSSQAWADLARFLNSLEAERRPDFQLLPYHPLGAAKYERLGRPYGFADLTPPTGEQMAQHRETLRAAGVAVLE